MWWPEIKRECDYSFVMMNKLIRSIIEINLKYQLFASPPWIQTLVGNSQEELKSTQVRWSHRTFIAIQSAGRLRVTMSILKTYGSLSFCISNPPLSVTKYWRENPVSTVEPSLRNWTNTWLQLVMKIVVGTIKPQYLGVV